MSKFIDVIVVLGLFILAILFLMKGSSGTIGAIK